ncbi:hypothetical protein BsWGS_06862 [Bradybaena similaris]
MMEKFAQRICINFCQKLGDTFTETYERLHKVYGDECMSRTRVFEWFKRFQDGRENVESDHRSGRPVTSRSEKHIADVSSTVRENRRITIRELSEVHSISFGSVQAILTEDLGMRRMSAKFERCCSSKKTRFACIRSMAAPPRQRTRPFSAACTAVFGQTQHSPGQTATLFSRSSSL